METVIGLGEAGCNIAEALSQHSQYQIYRIDSEKRSGKNFKLIKKQATHQEYERNCPSMKSFLSNVKGHVLMVTSGAGAISGAILRVLEGLQHCKISILYIKPDMDVLSEKQRLRQRAGMGILQEYARSAVFERIYIVDNLVMEDIIKDVPIAQYYDKLNELIASTFNMINVFKNSASKIDTFSDPVETARISTFGVFDMESGEEKLFYNLKMAREKCYYYAINKKQLASDGALLKSIKNQIRSAKKGADERISVSYGIYETEYDQNYVYVLSNASLVQEQNL